MQMQEYRESLEIIPPEMYGCRSNMGTTTALIEMGEQEQTEVRKGNLVSVCFMVILRGFDTLPHIYVSTSLQTGKNLGVCKQCLPTFLAGIADIF